MSTFYIISPDKETNWKLETDYFLTELKKDWPNIQVWDFYQDPDRRLVEWKEISQNILGSLISQQAISLHGYLKGCVKFALWFRKLVPIEQELLFYDDGYFNQIKLEAGTTEERIIEVMNG